MNKITIDLFGKKLNLRFGGLAWEYYTKHYSEHLSSDVDKSTLLIYASIVNEDEIVGGTQIEYKELFALVDSAFAFEKESAELKRVTEMVAETQMYKNILKNSSEPAKKKESVRKK